jgi:hypothetical protein
MPTYEDQVEVEVKFDIKAGEKSTVDTITSLFQGKYGFVRWPSEVKFDIYLDTRKLDLYRMNSTLRLRRWGNAFESDGFSCNFKYPPHISKGLRRRELKTSLTARESAQICDNGAIIGESLKHAVELMSQHSVVNPVFTPRVLIFSYRTYYILRPCNANAARRGSMPWPDSTLLRGASNNLLALSFDRCSAQVAPDNGYDRIIRNGFLDHDCSAMVKEFSEAELEIRASSENAELAERLYVQVFNSLKNMDVNMSEITKYSRAVRGLGLSLD